MVGGMPRVAIATAAEVADLDDEGRLLLRHLVDLGLAARAEVWDDPAVAWDGYDLVVVRSTWDYPLRRGAFLKWAEAVSQQTQLLNPPGMLRWTTDKRYLMDLASAEVPTVESIFIDSLGAADHGLLDVEHVVKPTISAGSKDTLRVAAGQRERSIAQIRAILDSGREAMAQPYLARVDDVGETALIYIDGEFSHAVRKAPILERDAGVLPGLFAAEGISPRPANARELAVGERVLAAIPEVAQAPALYARIDLIPDDHGDPLVLELELAEPSLYLQCHEPSSFHLASAINARLGDS